MYLNCHAIAHYVAGRLVGLRFRGYGVRGTDHPEVYPPGIRQLMQAAPFYVTLAIGDVVLAKIKGCSIYGEVLEIAASQVNFRPLCPGAAWRHATAREIVAHWRKTGRRGRNDPEEHPPAVPKEQLSLHLSG